jgi:uncharacterized protein YjiS (DUF1127 family)
MYRLTDHCVNVCIEIPKEIGDRMDTIRSTMLARAAAPPSLRDAATRALSGLFLWHARARSRATLAGLDDRLLADIGLSRADVARECDKPFWR